jgi:hypothetical protein
MKKIITMRTYNTIRYLLYSTILSLVLFTSFLSADQINYTWTKLSPPNSPSARNKSSMVYDKISGKIILFGGLDGSTLLNDTWSFDGTTWTQFPISPSNSPPAPAGFHGLR